MRLTTSAQMHSDDSVSA